jgi:hypothetical protein
MSTTPTSNITSQVPPPYWGNPFGTFADHALPLAALGIPVMPLKTGEKAAFLPGWQEEATARLDKIEEWNRQYADCNVGCVAKPNGCWFLDIDDLAVKGTIERDTGHRLDGLTFTVRTQKGGLHLYFKQNNESRALDNCKQSGIQGEELWSARVDNMYVVGPGSCVQGKDGKIRGYDAIDDREIVEAPDWLIRWLQAHRDRVQNVDANEDSSLQPGNITEGGRNNFLTSEAGKLRRIGLPVAAISAALLMVNQERCKPPLDTSEVQIIANSMGRYEPASQKGETDLTKWRNQFKEIHQMEEGNVRFLIDSFLPEGINFIGGLPGGGKTWFALSMARALTTGKKFLGNFAVPEPLNVIYLTPEVGERSFKKRVERMQVNPDRFLCRTMNQGLMMLDDPYLLEAVRELMPVVFLDTAVRFSPADSENDAAANAKGLATLLFQLITAGARGVVGIHHSTKNAGREQLDLQNTLRGTGDIAAMCDSVYGLKVISQDNLEIEVSCVKPRDFEPVRPFKIQGRPYIDEKGDFGMIAPPGKTKEQLNVERFLSAIKDNPRASFRQLEKITGLGKHAIENIAERTGWRKPGGGEWARVEGDEGRAGGQKEMPF